MQFRPMEDSDLAVVAETERSLHRSPWTLGNFRDSLAAGHQAVVAEEAGTLVAYAVTSHVLDEAELLTVGVPLAMQRQGRGAAMMRYLMDRLAAAGICRFFLEVRASNRAAHNLYRRCGFVEIGRRKGYYPAAEGREDAIAMALELPTTK